MVAEALEHRGPDDVGFYYDLENGVGLVHRRLSIIDLSDAGHQPMTSACGRYTIVFNGEIYNHAGLRDELISEGFEFVGHSDTEVLLRLFEKEGVSCSRKLVGMYAYAVWDRDERSLFLVRGPFGIKPLYYSEQGGEFVFASELRAMLALGVEAVILSRNGLLSYLKKGSVQEPNTLVEGVYALQSGSWLRWKGGRVETERFWKTGLSSNRISKMDDCVRITRNALLESVERHFVSDVPVGVFLSGGLDSTSLVALATILGKKELHTFCIAFDDPDYNEGAIAQRTARHFGTLHHEWRLGADEARSLLEEFLDSVDQPSIDGFNTYCVSKLARKCGMKVVLSGLGGDELFGSYPSFQLIPRMMTLYRLAGYSLLRKILGKALCHAKPYSNVERLGKFFLSGGTCQEAYDAVRTCFSDEEAKELLDHYCPEPSKKGAGPLQSFACFESSEDLSERVSDLEINGYMLNQLLRDSDVMSMANGLELRVPFLDPKLFDVLAQLSPEVRFAPNKQLLVSSVPEIPGWVSKQPKRGFTVPFVSWFGDDWKRGRANTEARMNKSGQKWYHDWSLYVLDQYLKRNLGR